VVGRMGVEAWKISGCGSSWLDLRAERWRLGVLVWETREIYLTRFFENLSIWERWGEKVGMIRISKRANELSSAGPLFQSWDIFAMSPPTSHHDVCPSNAGEP
jgi:hypothetical protein